MKKTLLTIITILFLVFSINLVLAKSVEVAEVPVYFVTHMTANQNYYKNLDISNIYDKELLSFEVIIKADFEPNTEIKVHLEDSDYDNDYWCLPNVWTTPNATVHNYEASFDCTGFFNSKKVAEKKVIIIFKTSKTSNNVRPRVKYTYYNPDKSNLNIMGTYYEVGDDAKVIAQLSQNGIGINNASCFASIYYPDNTIFLRDVFMHNIPNSDGLYVYDVTAPNIVGVYPVSVVCDYITNNEEFCYSNYTNMTGVVLEEDDDCSENNDYSKIKLIGNNNRSYFELEYNFTNVSSTNAVEGLFIEWKGLIEANDFLAKLYWWNYDDSAWEESNNQIINSSSQMTFNTPTNNISHYINNGIVRIKINGSARTTQGEVVYLNETFEQYADETLPDNGVWNEFETWATTGNMKYRVDSSSSPLIHGSKTLRAEGDGDYNKEEGGIDMNLNTTGKYNITLSYWRKTIGSESSDYFDVSATINGVDWFVLESWNGNSPLTKKVWHLNSSFDDNPDASISFYYNANHRSDKYSIDDIVLSYNANEEAYFLVDSIKLIEVKASGIVNALRGGGELNIKDKLTNVENKLDNISCSGGSTNIDSEKIVFLNPRNFNYEDNKSIIVHLTSFVDETINYDSANCSYSVFLINNSNSHPLIPIIQEQNMTNIGNGKYSAQINTLSSGSYQVEVNCVDGSKNAYGAFGFTILNDYFSLLKEINETTHLTLNNVTLSIFPQVKQNKDYLLSILTNQSTTYNKLIELQNNITNNYNELMNVKGMITNVNSSIISEVNKNYNLLLLMNDTINQILSEIVNNVEPHLNNISNNLTIIKNDLQTIIGYTDEVEDNQEIIINILQNINATINNINNTIIDVNNNLENMNLTINGELNNITNYLVYINQTTTNIYDILNCNYVNNVICDKLDNIQGNVSLLVSQTNYISNYLNGTITDYLIDINQTQHNIFDYLINNISVSINDNKNLLLSVLANQTICYNKLLEIQNNVTTNYYELQFVKAMIINVNQTLINESNQNENLLNNLLVEINENEQILIIINSSVNSIINDLDNIIKPQLNNISNKIDGLNNSINEVLINISTLNANQQLVLGNLSEIIDLINALNNNFSDLQSALTYINQTTISTNQKIDYLNNTLIIMNNTITKIDGNLVMMNATITKISNDVTELNITLNNISSKIDDLSLSLAFINDSIIDINKSVVIIDERLINLSELTNYSFNNLNSTLFDIKDIVLNINDSMINISDLIIELNNSMVNEHNNLTNLILSINGSLSSLINYDYEELVELINDSNNNLTSLINSNTNYLTGLIINTNVSLQERFDAVDNNIQLLLNNISIINDKLDCEYNRSIICEKLDNISSDLIIINSSLNTIYNYLNNTINNQLTNISSIVINTNYYLKNNLTIMINQSFNNLSTLINVSHQDIINYLQELNLTINELANDILNDTNNILTQIALMNTTITQSNTTIIYKKLLALEQMIADNYYFDEELVFLITDSVDKAKNINNEKNLITIRDNVYEINKKLRKDDEKPNYLKKFPILIFSSIIAIIIFIMIREKRIENNEKNNNNY